jgi:hypothetical protein
MDKIEKLKSLCVKHFNLYLYKLKRGHILHSDYYRDIKAAMVAITFIERYEPPKALQDSLIDHYIVKLNRL